MNVFKPTKGLSQEKTVFHSELKRNMSLKSKNYESGTYENKENKIKEFQSQKYMDLLSISNKNINLQNTLDPSNTRQPAKRPSILDFGDTKSNYYSPKNKIQTHLERYLECEEMMKAMCE